jgi:acyl carrier protein
MNSSAELYSIISKVLGVSESELNDNSSPESIENWDSFNGLVLADELESAFKIKFTMEEIESVFSISDIKKYLKNHGVEFDD